ncbi:MAG: hypothetical protein DWC05_04435, partial [Candidatus Poseidoniales archaeon]
MTVRLLHWKERTAGSLCKQPKQKGSEKNMKTKMMSVLLALFLALSAVSAASGDGSDPLDPSDGGADWDGDGLTNAE